MGTRENAQRKPLAFKRGVWGVCRCIKSRELGSSVLVIRPLREEGGGKEEAVKGREICQEKKS